MKIVPDSTITLYQNVEIDNDEQLAFSSLANQTAYFNSHKHPQGDYTPCTVVRKSGSLRVERSLAVVSACNYLSFVNPIGQWGDNKTVYARIVDYEYVNNECTEIVYVIDYWQTWMFDVTFQDMYIEREHLSEADFAKASINPYDPSIMEFRTNESLAFGKDVEKPYYSFGTTSDSDGIYCGDAVCSELGVSNRFGVLIAFSDINFSYLDDNIPAGTTTPSSEFVAMLNNIKISSSGSTPSEPMNFYKLSKDVYDYLHSTSPSIVSSQTYRGSGWDVTIDGTTYNIMPGSSGLKPPISYIFIDGGAAPATEFETATGKVSDLMGWFTRNSLDSIIGVYPIPTGLAILCGSSYGRPIGASLPTAIGQDVVNKKLDLYPYSYYRLIAPNGDVKELKIEDFKPAQDSASPCQIGMSLDIVEKPNLIVAPANYKAEGASPHNLVSNLNVREGMVFSQFPTLPYAIDAFIAQIAAVSNSIIGNNTVEYQNQMSLRGERINDTTINGAIDTLTNIGGVASAIKKGDFRGALNNGISAARNMRETMLNEQYSRKMYENEAKMSAGAYSAKLGLSNEGNNPVYENFQYTKPAYATAIYNQINGDGVTNFNYNSFVDILFMRVSLHPTIMAQYDNYFTHYGYTSGRCGIPRVVNFTKGITTNTEVPHWLTVNNKLTTFIKTRDCKVIHSMLPVAMYIKAMFDGGVRMIKGDPS
jgi:hypothetical protein